MSFSDVENIARQIRGKLVEMSHNANAPHLGSSLSCVDILVACYWKVLNIDPKDPKNDNRDRFILSKGHAAAALYATLAFRGFAPEKILETYNQEGSLLAEHPGPKSMPGVEAATGSLGHGLPIGVGMAVAAKVKGQNYKVYVVLSDGECNEGSVWEAALLAAANKLDNLTIIIDYNKWQATGRSNEVMQLEPLVDKWESFGWNTCEVDGHNIKALVNVMQKKSSSPKAIIAHTVKGKGISFMEDDNNWHYKIPTKEEIVKSHMELKL